MADVKTTKSGKNIVFCPRCEIAIPIEITNWPETVLCMRCGEEWPVIDDKQ